MSVASKEHLQAVTGELVLATATLMAQTNPATGKPYTLGEAERVVCQCTMDLYAWLAVAVADASPWPDPEGLPTPSSPTTPPKPTP